MKHFRFTVYQSSYTSYHIEADNIDDAVCEFNRRIESSVPPDTDEPIEHGIEAIYEEDADNGDWKMIASDIEVQKIVGDI